MKLTSNFNKSEFDCKSGADMPQEVFNNIQKLANQLQIIRNKVSVPIKINSGYRSPDYNDNVVKGSKNSQHKLGKAADIVIDGYTPDEVADLIEELIENGDILQGGLGRYNTFTHYDIGYNGLKRRWNFKK